MPGSVVAWGERVRVAFASLALATGLAVGGGVHGQAMAQAAPTSLELRGGVLAHDVPDLWAGFSLEGGIDINGELLFGRGLPFLGGTLRPALGASVNTEGYTSRATSMPAGRLRWGASSLAWVSAPPCTTVSSTPASPTARRWARACCSISPSRWAFGKPRRTRGDASDCRCGEQPPQCALRGRGRQRR